eukprot:CAMPEP_0194443666 /NCGR_PEP_ID=MMETSP0176-20130528/126838_1 /TAXON_ID=216777 /ORGANISM="Proboscia alata, Strain PI-D3" /LENGTH=892 /DNA_ID=CAMNT_0039269953 /DNA_START=281 /DNA_END=2956 /DNA_ORIENTATION=-
MSIKALILLLASISLSIVKADKIDDAIANAILFPKGDLCIGAGIDETTFSSVFSSTGGWHQQNAHYEEAAFEIEMTHNDKINSNHTWSMRLGKGGQIVSLIGPYGEANANQAASDSAWNDLVTQIVAVNSARDRKEPYKNYANFIHGSGPYLGDDGMPPPFYNPLVAMNCEGNQCTLVNWGQQAHVPTVHRSDLLYYQRYRDCGNGVIEYDQAIHHFGSDLTDVFDYFNTPWSNVRRSSLPQMMISDLSGKLEEPVKMDTFNAPGQLRDLDVTGGFTTFAQGPDEGSVSSPFNPGFCIALNKTGDINVLCDTEGSVEFTLTAQANGTATYSSYHSDAFGYYAVKMKANSFESGQVRKNCVYCNVLVTNSRTNFSFIIKHVIHWAYGGEWLYFGPSVTADVLNEEFKEGDEFVMTTLEFTRDDVFAHGGSALSFVHGINPEYGQPGNSFYNAKSRVRWGSTAASRDGTVWTTNFMGNLNPGETFYNRKYFISGSLDDAESTAKPFVPETQESVYTGENLNAEFDEGDVIQLHCDDDVFGATIGSESCWGGARSICYGSTVPKEGSKPLFFITCNETSYVGYDAYNFIPNAVDGELKPYICANEALSVRPTFKLLGYFDAVDCADLSGKAYVADFCSTFSSAPSTVPSTIHSSTPTSIPSSIPSLTPSSVPSVEPTSSPTVISCDDSPLNQSGLTPKGDGDFVQSNVNVDNLEIPTTYLVIPDQKITKSPTQSPNMPSPTPSYVMSVEPSFKPSMVPISSPSTVPSTNPSSTLTLIPVSMISLIPSSVPSVEPTSSPTVISCDDSPLNMVQKDRSCEWVGKKEEKRCERQKGEVKYHCRSTCGNPSSTLTLIPVSMISLIPSSVPSVEPTSSPTVTSCDDSPLNMFKNDKTCEW